MQEQGIELAVSTVVFALRPHPQTGELTLWLPLVRRIRQPYEGRWALPGGPLQPDEDLAASARRTLERTTGLTSQYLEQLYSFGEPDRSPQRVVSIVYWALVRSDEAALAVDGENVEWFVLRAKITYSPIARFFLSPEFTLAELRAVHEAVLRKKIDAANFRRQALATKTLVPTGTQLTGTSHRPPAVYRFQLDPADRSPR
jgi:8-oxo-dGTP diphosphatase